MLSKALVFKRTLLTITALTLVAGYFSRPELESKSQIRLYPIAQVYASTPENVELLIAEEVTLDAVSMNENNEVVDQKIEDLSIDAEHVRKIKEYLSARGAPLAAEAKTFVKYATKYGLPYNLMPAISVIESSGGLYMYRPYNYAGVGGQGAAKSYANFDEAIEDHAKILKTGYFDKGLTTPALIQYSYCPPCTTWGSKVQFVMNEIDAM